MDWERLKRGLRYAIGKTTMADAYVMQYEMNDRIGWFPLTTLAVRDVLDQFDTLGVRHERLEEFVDAACDRVASRFDSTDDLVIAQELAVEATYEYAADHGVILPPRGGATEEVTDGRSEQDGS